MMNGNNPQILGDPDARAKIALAQQLQAITTQIYIQTVSRILADDPADFGPDQMRALAKSADTAGRAFFEGLGLVQFTGGGR